MRNIPKDAAAASDRYPAIMATRFPQAGTRKVPDLTRTSGNRCRQNCNPQQPQIRYNRDTVAISRVQLYEPTRGNTS